MPGGRPRCRFEQHEQSRASMKLLHCCFYLPVLVLPLALAGAATDFDFFFHVQQWRGSYCNTRAGCCFPGDQKPAADFGIHGLWPNYADCRRSVEPADDQTKCWPDFCNATDPLNTSRIMDLESELLQNWGTLSCRSRNATELWSHEWRRHGTCSGMDQHAYFRAALDFKARFNLTGILAGAGIVPSKERAYELRSIRDAVTEATGSAPSVECNRNERDEAQLYRVYQCVGRDGKGPVHCPRHLESRCPDKVNFPAF